MTVRRILRALALFGILVLAGWLGWSLASAQRFAEASTIAQGATSFGELQARFRSLAQKKGGEYAYEILRRAVLPPNTDLHLLGHVVGDELYTQVGLDGIALCTQEFRNACSHTIVIGALTEYGGEAALPLIRDACKKAPGGTGAYTMCYHGLGHGVFAFFGYDLLQTVDFCKKTASPEYHDREYTECVGGAVMELMGGGGHDHEKWLESRARYLSSANPLAPCNAPWMPDASRLMCYVYLTPHLFEVAGADLAAPQPQHFKKAFQYCDRIPAEQPDLRDACFGGVGKEFPVLAMERDVRDMSKATDAQLSQMREWCALAPHEEARVSCEKSVLESLFWGGENDPQLSIRYCTLAGDAFASACYEKITSMGRAYLPSPSDRVALCTRMPPPYAAHCRTTLI